MTNTLNVFVILMFATGTGKALEALDHYKTRTFTVARSDGALQALLVSFSGKEPKLRFEATAPSNIPHVQEKAAKVLAGTTTLLAGAPVPAMKWSSRTTY